MTGIFLDRDGLIIRKAPEGEYIADWIAVEILARRVGGNCQTLPLRKHRHLRRESMRHNDGKIKLSSLDEIHQRMESTIANCGGSVVWNLLLSTILLKHASAESRCPRYPCSGCR